MESKIIKILAIDDLNDSLIILKAMIKDLFPEAIIFTALNGKIGFDIAIAEDPDVILLDILMPDMDGFEVCKMFKADKRLVDIPIVFLTTLIFDKHNRIRALETGAESFISKPIDEIELAAQIRAMVRIKNANLSKRYEKEQLYYLIETQNNELKETNIATLNLLEDLKAEIEEKKISEQKLLESEASLEKAQAMAHIGSWIWDLVSNTVRLSKEMYILFDIKSDKNDIYPEDLTKPIHPEDVSIVLRTINGILSDLDSSYFEFRVIHKDGAIYNVFAEGRIEHDQTGKSVRMVGTAQDITVRKKAEEDLRKANSFLDSIIENIPNMIFLKDADQLRFVSMNKAGEELLGLSRKEMLGKNDYDFFSKEQADGFVQNDIDVLINKTIKDIQEERIQTKYKGLRSLHTKKITLLNSLGKPEYLLGISEDITERKQLERLQYLSNEILNVLNSNINLRDMISNILAVIKEKTGFSAIGIRLEEGEDYPYFAQEGFSNDFLSEEDSLLVRNKESVICRDDKGNPILECTCGMVISGKQNPLLTNGGTYWTNNSYPLLKLPANMDSRINPRNNCVLNGYGSIALIPIRKNENIIGLLQLNDKKENAFNEDMIVHFESICKMLGVALMRKHAEEMLIKNELKFRTLADYTLDWEYWQSEDEQIIYMSPSCERITGYKPKEFISNPKLLLEIIHPDDAHIYQRHFNNILSSEHRNIIDVLDYRIINKEGLVININHVCRPVFDNNNIYLGRRVSNKDYTELRKEQEALKLSEERFRSLYENSPTPYHSVNEKAALIDVNPAWLRMLGYKKDEVIGRFFYEFTIDEQRNKYHDAFLEMKEVGFINNIELDLLCKSGEIISILLDGIINYTSEGKFNCTYTTLRDITKEKQIDKLLINAIIKSEEQQLSTFARELHDGLGPMLAATKLFLKTVELNKDKKNIKPLINQVNGVLDKSIIILKELSQNLSPQTLEFYGLDFALKTFLTTIKNDIINIEYKSNLDERFDNTIEISIYRVITEMITNSLKYSRADNINISINKNRNIIVILYLDDGCGFDLDEALKLNKGNGLYNIMNRMKSVDAEYKFLSSYGQGFQFNAKIKI